MVNTKERVIILINNLLYRVIYWTFYIVVTVICIQIEALGRVLMVGHYLGFDYLFIGVTDQKSSYTKY